MAEFDRSEVEAAFHNYVMTGLVYEDWQVWANLFTDDAVYTDHYYGRFTGPGEIVRFLEGTMGAAPQVYSPLKWYLIDGGRVVYEIVNRADNPEPGAAPIDFPSLQIIEYAGGGRWRSEEDIWVTGEMADFSARYQRALDAYPQTPQQRLSRRDWGPWVSWARPEPGHVAEPSWVTREGFVPFSGIADIDFGVRSH
ncbi:polyketide cyclase [Nocardia sp. 852002-20019_SCH5090214]|uniref:nuclear transport factor 2 family protein n=1 Tax=Nocardia sp. 852002-20019_SCH5090214 TaxID=1834087 RepID=UPI0007EAB071|nr:nuclear transport factor 2 family protein [Nocardia sp. 852002-20019_SCH5090214]OBA55808.1 polyketide cyclase [Nocardia sp. 852002-20019_SCH5090214]